MRNAFHPEGKKIKVCYELRVPAKQKVFISSKETVYQIALPRDLVVEGGRKESL